MSGEVFNYGLPSLGELEAFVNGVEYPEAAPARRGSIFTLSPAERARPLSPPALRATLTVAASAMAAAPSSGSSIVLSAVAEERLTPRPVLLVGKSIDPVYSVLRPLPGYADWIEHPALETTVANTMTKEIDTVQKLVLFRGVSLQDISAAVKSGTSVQALVAQTAKHVTFAPQIEEVIHYEVEEAIPDPIEEAIADPKEGCCTIQ